MMRPDKWVELVAAGAADRPALRGSAGTIDNSPRFQPAGAAGERIKSRRDGRNFVWIFCRPPGT